MSALHTYDYAVIRVVPRVERGEFVNVGVIVSCDALGSLTARIELDAARVRALDPGVDLEALRTALRAIESVCAGSATAGALGRLSTRERFHWLVAPRSAVIQTSPVHTGRTAAPDRIVDHLFEAMVAPARSA